MDGRYGHPTIPMKKLFLALAALSIVGILATFPIHSSVRSKAKLIQRIEKSASADMFGDEGTPIGEPTEYIIDDQKAFLGGPDDKGVYKVDEGYLKQNNPHPLQAKTVDFFASAFRIGFAMAALLTGIIGWRIRPRSF